jgi:hypothetical protein
MDQEDENQGPELLDKLTEEWNKLSASQPATVEFLKSSMRKKVDTGNQKFDYVAFFNNKLDINRFFIEDSDGKKATDTQKATNGGSGGMPGEGFGSGGTGFADNSDPFENELDEALCVFKSGDGNTDILDSNEKLIMFYIDLENEEIVNKQGLEEDKDQNEDTQGTHPILFNQYPVSANHSLLLLFADAGLPQVLSDELLVLVL